MKSFSRLAVGSLIACLTICQISQAAPKSNRARWTPVDKTSNVSSPKQKKIQNEQELEDSELEDYTYSSASELKADLKVPVSILGRAKSVLYPTPDENEVLLDFALTGQATAAKTSGTVQGHDVKWMSESSGFDTTIGTKYGLTDNFYFGANGSFSRSSSSQEIQTNATISSPNSKSTSEGFEEPKLVAGAQALMGRTRLIGELGVRVGVGPTKTKSSGNSTEVNALSGGSSFEPRLMFVSDLGAVRLLGQVGYQIEGERKSERESDGFKQNDTITGGNTLALGGGVEIPRLLNLGFMGAFGSTEHSETVSNSSGSISTYSSSAAQVGGAFAYMGIPAGRQTLFVPKVAYMTYLTKERNDMAIDQVDIWSFGLTTSFMF